MFASAYTYWHLSETLSGAPASGDDPSHVVAEYSVTVDGARLRDEAAARALLDNRMIGSIRQGLELSGLSDEAAAVKVEHRT